MPFKKHGRQYDVVVLGATGYTGLLTVEHIATTFPADLKWAVAGRSADKLQQAVSDCQASNPNRVLPSIEICNVDDEELGALARKTFCLITTLGPYSRHGEHAFKACAEAGTHYFDCTGEVPWTMSMIKKYDAAAKATGACMFPQDGLESGPSDLLTYALVSKIRAELSCHTSNVVMDLDRLDSAPTGGTFASFLAMYEAFDAEARNQALKPYAMSPVPNPHPTPKRSLATSLTGTVKVPGLGVLTSSPTGAMNAALVYRSWGLAKRESALQEGFYGPRFTYQEYMKAPNTLAGIIMHYTLAVATGALALSPMRALIRKCIFKPGDGPNKAKAKNDRIEYKAVAEPDSEAQINKRAFGTLSYTGSMYYLTAALLAQGAATILEDDVKLEGGIYTPSCLGQGYIDRLQRQGLRFETEIQNQDLS